MLSHEKVCALLKGLDEKIETRSDTVRL